MVCLTQCISEHFNSQKIENKHEIHDTWLAPYCTTFLKSLSHVDAYEVKKVGERDFTSRKAESGKKSLTMIKRLKSDF